MARDGSFRSSSARSRGSGASTRMRVIVGMRSQVFPSVRPTFSFEIWRSGRCEIIGRCTWVLQAYGSPSSALAPPRFPIPVPTLIGSFPPPSSCLCFLRLLPLVFVSVAVIYTLPRASDRNLLALPLFLRFLPPPPQFPSTFFTQHDFDDRTLLDPFLDIPKIHLCLFQPRVNERFR